MTAPVRFQRASQISSSDEVLEILPDERSTALATFTKAASDRSSERFRSMTSIL
nr:MAG TPA: hypothetical protein [Caudoviricetes sp.]